MTSTEVGGTGRQSNGSVLMSRYYSTADGSLLSSVEDTAIIGRGVICTNLEPAAPIVLVGDARAGTWWTKAPAFCSIRLEAAAPMQKCLVYFVKYGFDAHEKQYIVLFDHGLTVMLTTPLWSFVVHRLGRRACGRRLRRGYP